MLGLQQGEVCRDVAKAISSEISAQNHYSTYCPVLLCIFAKTSGVIFNLSHAISAVPSIH